MGLHYVKVVIKKGIHINFDKLKRKTKMGNEVQVIPKEELMSYSPQSLISQALAQQVPIETLERLMDLAERWDAKQAKSAFLKAMNQFQSEVPEILKSKQGHNNKFAPLPKITKTIQPALEKCGLSFRWKFEDVEGQIKCSCVVSHIAGHSETDTMTAGKDSSGNKSEIHAIGSTRTYLQRYTLIGALGLSTADQDTDAQTDKKKEDIPAPMDSNKEKEIKKCTTLKQLEELFNKMPESERTTYRKTFSSVKAMIKDAEKKEGK